MTAETILQELQTAIERTKSPWAGRSQAAAYCDCSATEIDKAANSGAIPRHWRESSPIFKKSDLDKWIEGGQIPASRAKRGFAKAAQLRAKQI